MPTTSAGPYTLNLYTDNPVVTLKALQQGTAGEASFVYNWLAACGGSPRLGATAEPTALLYVKLLGNPVHDLVEVEVTGTEGAPLQLSLTDTQGRLAGESQTGQAGPVERYRFNVSTQPAGILLLRVSSSSQTRTVRVLNVK